MMAAPLRLWSAVRDGLAVAGIFLAVVLAYTMPLPYECAQTPYCTGILWSFVQLVYAILITAAVSLTLLVHRHRHWLLGLTQPGGAAADE